ncbi:hypothetical protein J6590_086224 [Homalodisca vitripennis]|nr:hypothetical protein J6590_086224 [Homalodisca vitripennis]
MAVCLKVSQEQALGYLYIGKIKYNAASVSNQENNSHNKTSSNQFKAVNLPS